MHPGEIAITANQAVELRLLTDPEHTECQEIHEIGDDAWRQCDQGVPQVAFGVNRLTCGNAQIEHEQRKRDREDAIAQPCEPFHALPCEQVVRRAHGSLPDLRNRSGRWRESSTPGIWLQAAYLENLSA
jgi:hypothetical protein